MPKTLVAKVAREIYEGAQNLTLEDIRAHIISAPSRYKQWWLNLLQESPGHVVVETALIIFIVWLVFIRKTVNPDKDDDKDELTPKEVAELLKEWKPEPLVPPLKDDWVADAALDLVVEKVEGNHVYLLDFPKPVLNLATFDFLGMGQRKEVKDAAVKALNKYGCGSCGPRGFYGSIDVHVHCEERVAKFMKMEEAISYSDSASAVSSVLPAFAKRGDLLVVDQGVYEPIQTAINLSRSTAKYFKHNDMDDLERVLKEIIAEDRRVGRNVLEQRRFIVVEGLYKNYGDMAPLRKLIEIKKKYFFRLYVDETFSFGCFGTGRGLTEYFNVDAKDIDIMSVSMAHALASVGGLCVGTTEVVDHQRLSGAGYCYSASAPPFVSSAAMAAIDLLEAHPEWVKTLNENARYMHDAIQEIPVLQVTSQRDSPVIHVRAHASLALTKEEEAAALRKISSECFDGGVAIVTSKYIGNELFTPHKTLRITVTAAHTREQLAMAVQVLKDAANKVLMCCTVFKIVWVHGGRF